MLIVAFDSFPFEIFPLVVPSSACLDAADSGYCLEKLQYALSEVLFDYSSSDQSAVRDNCRSDFGTVYRIYATYKLLY